MNNNQNILIIDDEPQMRRLLKLTLEVAGFSVFPTESAIVGLTYVKTHVPALIILDLVLPDSNGMDTLSAIRATSNAPVIILSVISQKEKIIQALDRGANDYICKPFHSGELLARIRSVLRHSQNKEFEETYTFQDLHIDIPSHQVTRGEQLIKLTTTEFSLLSLLARNADKVLTHRFILEQVWGPAHVEDTQYSRIYVAQLRKKIENDPSRPTLIMTESGIGYRLISNPQS